MNQSTRRAALHAPALKFAVAAALLGASALALAVPVQLEGGQEVPPVQTGAHGSGAIDVAADGSVSGQVSTTGIQGTMAHIHRAAAGKNGPVVIPLEAGANGTWKVPAGAKLDAEQMKAYQAGELYVNVHSDAHKGGEIRAQIKP
jgi:hypothetical protein